MNISEFVDSLPAGSFKELFEACVSRAKREGLTIPNLALDFAEAVVNRTTDLVIKNAERLKETKKVFDSLLGRE